MLKIHFMREITKAQEEVLMALWEINEGAVSDVLEIMPEPKPAYNTIATVIKVLEKKNYVSHKTYGKTNVYFPLVPKKEYAQFILKDTIKGFFNGSLNQMVSCFVQNKNISISELEDLKNMLDREINEKNLE